MLNEEASSNNQDDVVDSMPLAAAMRGWCRSLGEPEQAVVAEMQSLGADYPLTLLRTTNAQGVCEYDAEAVLDEVRRGFWIVADSSPALGQAVAGFRNATSSPATPDELCEWHPWMAVAVDGTGTTALDLLVAMCPDVVLRGGWIFGGDLEGLKCATRQALRTTSGEYMSVGAARRHLTASGLNVRMSVAWLNECGYDYADGQIVDRGSSDLATEEEKTSVAQPPGIPTDAPSIRAWATANGWQVSHRGRLAEELREAYFEAHALQLDDADAENGPPKKADEDTAAPVGPASSDDDPSVSSSLAEALGKLASYANASGHTLTLGEALRKCLALVDHDEERRLARSILEARPTEQGWVLADPAPGATDASVPPVARQDSLADRAFAYLSSVGHPLRTHPLASRMGKDTDERSLRSLRKRLSSDKRFMRSSPDTWALTEWNLRGYTSIRELVAEKVDAAGGEIRIDELVDVLTRNFAIKESSVCQTASTTPFNTRDGVVRRIADLGAGQGDTRQVLPDTQSPDEVDDAPSVDVLLRELEL